MKTTTTLGLSALSLALILVTGCGGIETITHTETCDLLPGNTYLSEALLTGGFDAQGVHKAHWRAEFNKGGQLSLFQTDYGVTGTYFCANGEVTIDSSETGRQVITVSQDLSTVSLTLNGHGLNAPITYRRTPANKEANNLCSAVAGRKYQDDLTAAERNVGYGVGLTLNFRAGQNVEIFNGDAGYFAYMDCQTDQLHLHRILGSSNDTKPILITALGTDGGLRADVDGTIFTLKEKVAAPIACTTNYLPVCGIEPQNLQCIKAPCPIGAFKTYGNQCEADAAKAIFAANGECGAKENQTAWSASLPREPTICTADYVPVCGVEQQQLKCVGTACFIHLFKTYGNQCEASAANSTLSTPGECGKLEGTVAPY